jgi:hypothetical protein
MGNWPQTVLQKMDSHFHVLLLFSSSWQPNLMLMTKFANGLCFVITKN